MKPYTKNHKVENELRISVKLRLGCQDDKTIADWLRVKLGEGKRITDLIKCGLMLRMDLEKQVENIEAVVGA